MDQKISNEVSTNVDIKAIKGLLPAFDARQPADPFIMDGRNFVLDTKGVKSSFSNKILSYSQLYTPACSATVRFGTTVFYCTFGAIMLYDNVTNQWYSVYTFADDGSQWPWSSATCGHAYYFCRKGVGVIEYVPSTNTWMLIDPTQLPADPRAITQAYGHLICVGQYYTAWSAQDDGTNWIATLSSSAGAQGHTIISGNANGITAKQTNSGFLVYTDSGAYEGQLSFSGAPFRFIPYNRAFAPINPFCFADIDDTTHVVLDVKGMFKVIVDGLSPYMDAGQSTNNTPFDPEFNQYLTETLLPSKDLSIQTSIRMFYDKTNKSLYLSIADDSNPTLYTMAFVNYTPRGEWGRFDYSHYFVGEVQLTQGASKGDVVGFCDSKGYFRRFISDVFAESWPALPDYYNWAPMFEVPVRIQTTQNTASSNSTVTIFGSLARCTDYSEAVLFTLTGGLYTLTTTEAIEPILTGAPVPEVAVLISVSVFDWNTSTDPSEDWNTIPDGTADEDYSTGSLGYVFGSQGNFSSGNYTQTPVFYSAVTAPLNSYVIVGLLHMQEEQYDDELAMVTNIMVGVDNNPGGAIFDDYATDNNFGSDIIEDFATENTSEDYGIAAVNVSSFNLTINGFLDDGTTVFETEVPTLEELAASAQYYTCTTNGIYHNVELSATSVGQTFHLKLLDMSGIYTGRL